MADINDETKAKLVQAARERIARQLLPALSDPRNRVRTIVAMKVLSIVDREIGRGEPPLEEEWAKLQEAVADHEGAGELVNNLKDAIRAYGDDLDTKIRAGEVEEEPARAAALKVIRLALLKKIKLVEPKPVAP